MRWFVSMILAFGFSTVAFAGGPDAGAEQKALDAVRAENPKQYEKLVALRDTDPGRYHQVLRRVGLRAELRASDPTAKGREDEMKRLHEQIAGLAEGAQTLDAKALAERRAQIKPLASRLFDLRVAERQAMLTLADDNNGKRRDKLDGKVAGKDKIVDEKVDAILAGKERRHHKGLKSPGL